MKTWTGIDLLTGLTLRYEYIADACPGCRGRGVITFSTEQDLANYEDRDGMCSCDDYGPETSGVHNCETCKGSGRVDGAQADAILRVHLEPVNLFALPHSMFDEPAA